MKAFNCYHKALHLGCCSIPRSVYELKWKDILLLVNSITFFSQQWRPKDFVNLATFYNQENLVPFSEKWLPENSKEMVSFFLSDLVFFLEKNWSFQWLSLLLKELMRLTLYNWWELYTVNCNENCYHGLKQNIFFINRDYSFSTIAKFSEELTILTLWYAHVRLLIRG